MNPVTRRRSQSSAPCGVRRGRAERTLADSRPGSPGAPEPHLFSYIAIGHVRERDNHGQSRSLLTQKKKEDRTEK